MCRDGSWASGRRQDFRMFAADATPALVRAEVRVGSLDSPMRLGKNIVFAIVGCTGKLVFHQNKLTGLLTGSTATDCEEYDFCSLD